MRGQIDGLGTDGSRHVGVTPGFGAGEGGALVTATIGPWSAPAAGKPPGGGEGAPGGSWRTGFPTSHPSIAPATTVVPLRRREGEAQRRGSAVAKHTAPPGARSDLGVQMTLGGSRIWGDLDLGPLCRALRIPPTWATHSGESQSSAGPGCGQSTPPAGHGRNPRSYEHWYSG